MRLSILLPVGVGLLVGVLPHDAFAAPGIELDLGGEPQAQVGAALKMAAILTVLSVAPAILLATTSFLRIVVVFSFLRSALGVQGMPPNQVLIGLALFLTTAIMAPIGTQIYETGVQPYMDGKLPGREAFEIGAKPLRQFMLRQTREADLELFYEISVANRPNTVDDVGLHLLVPAFITSELRTAFEMGFMLFIPFLLLDLVIGSILMSMGMVMLPPALISLPIKIMLFVLADGWHLLIGSLVRSFG